MSESTQTELTVELDKLKACIHCGFCLTTCPTYLVTGSEAESPRGRLYMMKHYLNADTEDDKTLEADEIAPHLDQCLGCLACETACPSGVQYGDLLVATREDLNKKTHRPGRFLRRFIYEKVLTNHGLLLLLRKLLRIYQRLGIQKLVRQLNILSLIPSLKTQEALLPKVPSHKHLRQGLSFGNLNGPHVVIFTGCVMDIFYNPVHWDTVEVLAQNGYYITVPAQNCCGALAHHSGENDITTILAKKNVTSILKSNPDYIVVNSAGCGSTLKDYAHLLETDPIYKTRVREFSKKVVDVMELLAKKPLKPIKTPLNKTITYHAACHLYHAQQIQNTPEALLKQIPGLTLKPLKDKALCCGSAGIFNIEQPELAKEILEMKIDCLKDTGAKTVVTGNPGCLLQIEHGLKNASVEMNVQHTISILAEAYRQDGAIT